MILLLGGTGAARHLAELIAPDLPVIASLSGATKSPKAYPCETRIGGFGGPQKMAEWIGGHGITAIIDATHPFAAQISANAVAASRVTNTPIVSVNRPEWTPAHHEVWHRFPDLSDAVAALPRGARVFFATGRGGIDTISARHDVWSALRVVDDPCTAFPGNGEFIIARPPFDIGAEKALFKMLGITHLVAKNAGGAAARTKLDAAAALRLPTYLIDRPSGPRAPGLPVPEIPAWAATRMAARERESADANIGAKRPQDAASDA